MKVRPILARVALVAGVAGVVSLAARDAPHQQTLVIRLGSRDVTRVAGVVTQVGEQEPNAGFSRDFPETSPHSVRHTFSAPHGDYSISVTFSERPAPGAGAGAGAGAAAAAAATTRPGDDGPIPRETSFERRVNLAGGEVVLSPD